MCGKCQACRDLLTALAEPLAEDPECTPEEGLSGETTPVKLTFSKSSSLGSK